MDRVDAVLVGAGLRGSETYGRYAERHGERLRIVALAEPRTEARDALARRLGLPAAAQFADWRELFAGERRAPAAIIATSDHEHTGPALAALERGHHVLLEKPIAPTPEECSAIVDAAEQAGRILKIAHVLRYTVFYREVARILESGRLGRLLTIDMKEHIAHWHMTHSYVRGKFRNRAMAAPIILAKCCHDLDLLLWLAGQAPQRVVSFGALSHYRPEHAPPGAPERCSDGCPVQEQCPHDALRFYLGPDDALARGWPWSDVSPDPSREARRRALETGRYGRCVYHCDNDVPDHQTLLVAFADGLQATFTVQGHATHETRTIRVSGSEGELRGLLREGRIELSRHGSLEQEQIDLAGREVGHFGGDQGLLDHFTDVVARGAIDEAHTSGRVSLASHMLGFAAERSRVEGRVIEL
jgi:predicted dehydrogenase